LIALEIDLGLDLQRFPYFCYIARQKKR